MKFNVSRCQVVGIFFFSFTTPRRHFWHLSRDLQEIQASKDIQYLFTSFFWTADFTISTMMWPQWPNGCKIGLGLKDVCLLRSNAFKMNVKIFVLRKLKRTDLNHKFQTAI